LIFLFIKSESNWLCPRRTASVRRSVSKVYLGWNWSIFPQPCRIQSSLVI